MADNVVAIYTGSIGNIPTKKEVIVDDGEVPGCSRWFKLDSITADCHFVDQVELEVEPLEDLKFEEAIEKLKGGLVPDIDLEDEDEVEDGNIDVASDSEEEESEDDINDMETQEVEIAKAGPDKSERCPHPAPKKGRGRRGQKRKIDEVTVQNEACTVVSILKHRKSLKDDCLGGIEVGPRMDKRLIPLITYDQDMIHIEEKQSVVLKQMKFYIGFLESLSRRLYAEHTRYLLLKCGRGCEFKNTSIKDLKWVEPFCQKYQKFFPILKRQSMEEKILLESTVKNITSRLLYDTMRINSTLQESRRNIDDMIYFIEGIMTAKTSLADQFEQQYNATTGVNVKLDETSIWGMKPLRLALDRPYFKTEDGMLAAPLPPEGLELQEKYGRCFFRRDMQKWTTKDIVALKQCVKEVLSERKLNFVRGRYQDLVQDSRAQKAKDEAAAGNGTGLLSEPVKRKRGRPKKADVLKEEQYGKIFPVLTVLPNGIIIRSQVSPKLLGEWRTTEERRIKSLSYEAILMEEKGRVDWEAVSQKMIVKTRKIRSDEDCALAFKHEADPAVKTKRWSMEETKQLKEIVARVGHRRWNVVAELFNKSNIYENKPLRTSYQCYFRYRNRIEPPKKMIWDDGKDKLAKKWIEQTNGNWRIVAEKFHDPAATKRQIIERYKKNINPVLRNGAFTRVEDCLLLLTIQKLKPFIAREGHFGSLLAYLPWRFETTWRDRANNLFSDWIVPWTLEEDEKLMQLAITMKRNWQKISEEFTSFKNRKGCLTRYKILQRRLKDGRYNNLQEYHEAYAMTRYNVFQYKHLKEIVALLKKVDSTDIPEQFRKFLGLVRDTPPSEHQLQHMLMSFDKDIVRQTIFSLEKYIASRDEFWKTWISEHGKRRRTFDRRTFHSDSAQSVASAIHIRDLQLKPKSEVSNLSDFESEIYKFYAQFCRTKAIKRSTARPYIPSARKLANWFMIKRLVATPIDSLPVDEVQKKVKGKGKGGRNAADLDNDDWLSLDESGNGGTPTTRKTPTASGKRRGRPPKNLSLDSLEKPKKEPRKPRQSTGKKRKSENEDASTPQVKRKVGRPRKVVQYTEDSPGNN